MNIDQDQKISEGEEDAVISCFNAVFSDSHGEGTKPKRPLASSFACHFPQTSTFSPETDAEKHFESKDSQIERPNSLINLKNTQMQGISNTEKRLNPSAANFFIELDASGSDSKLIKKPQKKTLRVSEAESTSYHLDPNKVGSN